MLAFLTLSALAIRPGEAATIGVLSDGRQAEFLSLLGGSSAAARAALVADGHQIVTLASLSPTAIRTVDVLWLPVLDVFPTYTAQERADLVQYVSEGGRVIFIGEADVFNTPDDSFLTAFGMHKNVGNLNPVLSPAAPPHPSVTGPHGSVTAFGRNAGYGVFTPSAQTTVVFNAAGGAGAVVGCLDAASGLTGDGRLAIICDSSVFGQLLDQDSHKAFLRNVVKWAAAAPGYTPSGGNVSAAPMTVQLPDIDSIGVTFEQVSVTGECAAAAIGAGRCGFTDIPNAALPTGFVGVGVRLTTTAVTTGSLTLRIEYDAAALATLGIADPSALLLLRYDESAQVLVNTAAVVDATARTVTGSAPGVGRFLLGAIVPGFPDCNANGVPDACEAAVSMTTAVEPAGSGTVTPPGPTTRPVCDDVTISATPAPGYCFTNWTVSPTTAQLPANPTGTQTTVRMDVSKTVTGVFRKVIVASPANVTACLGSTATLSVQVHELDAPTATYQWRKFGVNMPDRTAATLELTTVATGDAGNYDVVVTTPCGAFTSDAATLTIQTPPAITADPQNRSACRGSDAAFSVIATGTPAPSYQWRHAGQAIVGATGPSLTVTTVDAEDAGAYDVQVTNTCGSAISSAATLTVRMPPAITTQPVGATVCLGQPIGLSVAASGSTPLQYQWRRNGTNITGATADTYSVTAAAAANGGAYTVVVMNDCGAVTSDSAGVTVRLPPTIQTQPTETSVCVNATATLSVAATGAAPLAYQWRKDGSDVSGATEATLSIPNATAAANGLYDVIVTNDCGSATSAPARLTVRDQTAVTTQPAARTACPGTTTVFNVAAAGSNLSYQWRFNAGSGYANVVNGTGISGATTATLTLTNVATARAGSYLCVIAGACGTVSSDAAALTVTNGACDCNANGTADADDIAAGAADCNGNLIPDSCELASGAAHDCNGNGRLDACDIADGSAADCDLDSIPDDCAIAAGTKADCNGNGVPDNCDIATDVATDCNHNGVPDSCDPPYLADAGPDLPLCVGSPSPPLGGTVVATGSTPPYTYQWQVLSGPAGGGAFTSATAQRPRFTATQTGIYVVQLTVSDFSSPPCTTTDTVTLTVEPMTIDAGAGWTMCAGSTSTALAPTITGGTPPLTYHWTIDAGAPSQSPTLFGGSGPTTATPNFTPAQAGTYVLRLTVTDAKSPPCMVSDTLTVRAVSLGLSMPSGMAVPVGVDSPTLLPTVSAPSDAVLQYQWSIEPGSAASDMGQLIGGADRRDPRFRPAVPGEYRLRMTVQDSGTPACTATGVMTILATTLSVDAGAEAALCTSGLGMKLKPVLTGGYGTMSASWSIEPGSPNTDLGQFTPSGGAGLEPRFTPNAPGVYTLRVTAKDSSTPPCVATDTVVVRAAQVIADAGADGVVQAFEPSVPLGGAAVGSGGAGPYQYTWRIVSGPSTAVAQLDNATAARPRFTPTSTGAYLLEVSVADGSAGGCTAVDRVGLEAIAARQTLPVNVEGRVFMDLRIDLPNRAAQLRIAEGPVGKSVIGELKPILAGETLRGAGDGLDRRLVVGGDAMSATQIVTIVFYYADAELNDLAPSALRVLRYNAASDRWLVAGSTFVGDKPYPVRAARTDVGRYGVDTAAKCVWAVVDRLADFTARVPAAVGPDPISEPNPTGPGGSGGDGSTDDPSNPPAATPTPGGGMCGAGTGTTAVVGLFWSVLGLRRRTMQARGVR